MTSKQLPQTVLHARKTQVVVGPYKPFVMIGERINPTNRAKLSESMESHATSVVVRDAEAQVAAGAQILDTNVGTRPSGPPTCYWVSTRAASDGSSSSVTSKRSNDATFGAGFALRIWRTG